MGKLRHIAMAVPNTDATAKFYEQAFGMKRVRESTSAILLSDGVISLAILDNKNSHEALGHLGLHHVGFIAENVDEAAGQAEKSGAVYADKDENVAKRFANRGQEENGKLIYSFDFKTEGKSGVYGVTVDATWTSGVDEIGPEKVSATGHGRTSATNR